MNALDALAVLIAVTCFYVARAESRRAEQMVAKLLEREAENRAERAQAEAEGRDARAELVQVFLDEQRRQEDAHAGERAAFRDERAELINALLSVQVGAPQPIAPAWPGSQPAKLYHNEEDEIREARVRVAAEIEAELANRVSMMPDEGIAA